MEKVGSGLLNTVINKLPIELHLPGYQYCGPGTHLDKRLARGDPGINSLDKACKEHDIAYSQHKDLRKRHEADKILAEKAWNRAKKSPSLKERLAGLTVAGAMKTKIKLGMGIGRNKKSTDVKKTFRDVVARARIAAKPAKNVKSAIKLALQAARTAAKKRQKGVLSTRIIPIPKKGGILPLIPIFAGLSALGALAGGAAGIAKTVTDASSAKQNLKEAERHNKTMEAIALHGKGLFLKPYKRGYGLVIMPKNCRKGR